MIWNLLAVLFVVFALGWVLIGWKLERAKRLSATMIIINVAAATGCALAGVIECACM